MCICDFQAMRVFYWLRSVNCHDSFRLELTRTMSHMLFANTIRSGQIISMIISWLYVTYRYIAR